MMRATLLPALLLSLMLAACASTKDVSANKHISQEGALKVHPGLLGQPVPRELTPETSTTQTPAATSAEVLEKPIKLDQNGLRTQRSVYFDYNSAIVKTDFSEMLQAHARYLASHPQSRVRIEGNADERGSAEFNVRLGMLRAENVRNTMIEQGASTRQVSVKTLGETHPKLKGHDEASWAENRRADVVYEKEI